MSEAPRAVREAALSAFDARRPGTPVLDLVRDLPVRSVVGSSHLPYRELRFAQDGQTTNLVVEVTADDGALGLLVSVEPDATEYRLEVSQVNGTGTTVAKGFSPFELTGVIPGLISLLLSSGEVGTQDEQRWQTAWVRL